jgi:hypothetical protein
VPSRPPWSPLVWLRKAKIGLLFLLIFPLVGAISVHLSTKSNHWVVTVNSQFNGTRGRLADDALPAPWSAYRYPNSRYNGGWYRPEHCVIANGMLSLVQKYDPTGPAAGTRRVGYEPDGGGWYQCAVTTEPEVDAVDYRLTMRLRVVPSGLPDVISHRNMPLRWPRSEIWTSDGEENFFENDGSLATSAGAFSVFLHYGADNRLIRLPYPALDVTQWHTYRQQRLNHRVSVWIDDVLVIDKQLTAVELPDTLKRVVFQQENPRTGSPRGVIGQEKIQLDWVVIEKPAE